MFAREWRRLGSEFERPGDFPFNRRAPDFARARRVFERLKNV
jgi:hypothetical protein